MISALNSGPGGTPNIYVIEAMGYLGNREIEPKLVSFLEDPALKEKEYLLEKTAIALSMIGNRLGLNYFREIIEAESTSNMDVTKFLGSFGSDSDVSFFEDRLKKTENPFWKIKLIEGLGILGSLHAIPVLLEYLSDQNVMVREAVDKSLCLLTGNTVEHDPIEDSLIHVTEDWIDWWTSNSSSMDKSKRHRDGKPFDIRYWVEKLIDPDMLTRKIAHRSLIIYTSQHFPFDCYGFTIDQEKASEVWKAWFEENDNFPAGNWYFNGVKSSK